MNVTCATRPLRPTVHQPRSNPRPTSPPHPPRLVVPSTRRAHRHNSHLVPRLRHAESQPSRSGDLDQERRCSVSRTRTVCPRALIYRKRPAGLASALAWFECVRGDVDPRLVVLDHKLDVANWLAPDVEADQRIADRPGGHYLGIGD